MVLAVLFLMFGLAILGRDDSLISVVSYRLGSLPSLPSAFIHGQAEALGLRALNMNLLKATTPTELWRKLFAMFNHIFSQPVNQFWKSMGHYGPVFKAMTVKWVPTPGSNSSSIYDHLEKYAICCFGSLEKCFSLHLETRTSSQRRKHTCQPACIIRTAGPKETQWSTIMARLRMVEVNGIRMRIAEEGACSIVGGVFYLLGARWFSNWNIQLLLRKCY